MDVRNQEEEEKSSEHSYKGSKIGESFKGKRSKSPFSRSKEERFNRHFYYSVFHTKESSYSSRVGSRQPCEGLG